MRRFLGKITIAFFLALIVGVFGYWQETSKAQEELPLFVKEPIPVEPRPINYVPDEIIVKFKPGIQKNIIQEINQQQGTSEIYESPFARFKVLKIPTGKTVPEMVEIYKKNPQVEYAEPNYMAHVSMVPNDTFYQYQWHLDNPTYGGIQMEEAWDIETGSNSVIVAVIDTGVAYENYPIPSYELSTVKSGVTSYQKAPDLAGTNFVAGYDFVHNDTHPNDNNSHGTHVTGTIAQTTNNNLGVAGIAFNTSIMPVKVLDQAGCGTYADVVDGIYFATDNGAKIINMSLGGPASTTLENAVAYAYNNGVVVVAASGNGNTSPIDYPAGYDNYVVAIGATRYDETRAYYSNYGTSLDLVAPGGDVTVDQNGDGYADGVLQNTFTPYEDRGTICASPGDKKADPTSFAYYFFQGTSMATPHVAGVAALLLAYKPSLTPSEVRNILQSTAEDKGAAGRDNTYGYGIVDAYAALLSLVPPVSITLTTDGSVNFGILGLGAMQDTTASGLNDVQTISVDTGPANLDVKSTVFSDGTNTWMLGSTNGANQVKWEFSPQGTSWTTFALANTLYPLASSVAQGSTQNVYFRLTMPTSTISNNPYSAQVTIVATAP